MSEASLLDPTVMQEVAQRARQTQARIIDFIIAEQQDASGLVYGQVALGLRERVLKVLDMKDPRFLDPMGRPTSIFDELRRLNLKLADAIDDQFERDVRTARMEEVA